MNYDNDVVSLERPDLEEFLSALGGFLETQTTPQDPSYLKFLEIFCRSLGAGEGHLLKNTRTGALESIVSFGIGAGFDKEYNEGRLSHPGQLTPLDTAFLEQRVVAIVEIKPGDDMPAWYLSLTDRYGFKSCVAVPLLGHSKPVGILCAYYHDVCLFDQGTLDRLSVIGRMVGAATEKSAVAERAATHDVKEQALDEYLKSLTSASFSKLQLYGFLAKVVEKVIGCTAVLAGPVRSVDDALFMTVADGAGIPSSAISQRFALPPAVQWRLSQSARGPIAVTAGEWGGFAPLARDGDASVLCAPMNWQGQLQAAVVLWRQGDRPFEEEDELLLQRLSGITALALNAS